MLHSIRLVDDNVLACGQDHAAIVANGMSIRGAGRMKEG